MERIERELNIVRMRGIAWQFQKLFFLAFNTSARNNF